MTVRLALGVVGHVDHGKTALVRALTGIETDRLAEEKRRGISIALGFAHVGLPGGAEIDLIDTPGHERFVRTMIAGASGIGAVLLVVSAAEGIKPQTREHVDIAGLLGLRHAVVAVTKADLVDADAAQAIGAASVGLLAGCGLLAGPPILTSAVTGAGLPALREAIAALAMLRLSPAARDDGFAYLPIDRAFSVAGHGSVVTGTLRRGRLATGDTLHVVPGDRPVRVRLVHVHGQAVEAAEPGQRVAVNLRGVDLAGLAPGLALATPDLLPACDWLSVRIQAVAGAAPLPTGARLRLLFGTTEVEARLRLLDREQLEGGQSAIAQLRCTPAVAIPAREAVILRVASPACTVAGGRVIDPETTRQRRHAAAVISRLAALDAASPAAIVVGDLAAAGARGASLRRLARIAGLAPHRAAAALQGPGAVLLRHGQAVSAAGLAAVGARLPVLLAEHGGGLSREGLGARLPGAGPAVLDTALQRLLDAGTLAQQRGLFVLARPAAGSSQARHAEARQAQDLAEAARAAAIVAALRGAGLTPPDAAALAADPPGQRVLERLARAGAVIKTTDQVQRRAVYFHPDAVAEARRLLTPHLADPGLLVREAGALLGISRKYAVPLLEHLDAIRFTRRVADRRVLAHSG